MFLLPLADWEAVVCSGCWLVLCSQGRGGGGDEWRVVNHHHHHHPLPIRNSQWCLQELVVRPL